MNKKELIADVAARVNGLAKKEVSAAVEALLEAIANDLNAGNKVSISNFGVFNVVNREARVGRNPQTGVSIQIPAKKAVKFKPAKYLRALVSGEDITAEDD